MHKAMFFEKLENKKVRCTLCPHNCIIKEGNSGICSMRINNNGILYSLSYGLLSSIAIDPVEKKPLYHFYPGSKTLSISTFGCNMKCSFCQNFNISQSEMFKSILDESGDNNVTPIEIIKKALENGCKSISYTYNEPTIFYEFVLETAKLARKNGIKNIMVTNGFINIEPAKKLYKYIDAANVDLKSINDAYYSKFCKAKIEPVLDLIKYLYSKGVHLELTNLLVSNENDSLTDIDKLCKWVSDNIGVEIPLHFSRFYPMYKLNDKDATSVKKVEEAYNLAKKYGFVNVYLGNVGNLNKGSKNYSNTICTCGQELIIREGYSILSNSLVKGKCSKCLKKCYGEF